MAYTIVIAVTFPIKFCNTELFKVQLKLGGQLSDQTMLSKRKSVRN